VHLKYTMFLRAVLPRTHAKITTFKDALVNNQHDLYDISY
jgi:hypothetical protein